MGAILSDNIARVYSVTYKNYNSLQCATMLGSVISCIRFVSVQQLQRSQFGDLTQFGQDIGRFNYIKIKYSKQNNIKVGQNLSPSCCSNNASHDFDVFIRPVTYPLQAMIVAQLIWGLNKFGQVISRFNYKIKYISQNITP